MQKHARDIHTGVYEYSHDLIPTKWDAELLLSRLIALYIRQNCSIPKGGNSPLAAYFIVQIIPYKQKRVFTQLFLKRDGDRRCGELLTCVYQPQCLKDSLAKCFDVLQLHCEGLQQKHCADKANRHTLPVVWWLHCLGSDCVSMNVWRRLGARAHI